MGTALLPAGCGGGAAGGFIREEGGGKMQPFCPPEWEGKTPLAKAECLWFHLQRSAGLRPELQPGLTQAERLTWPAPSAKGDSLDSPHRPSQVPPESESVFVLCGCVTNCYKVGTLKQHPFISQSCVGQKPRWAQLNSQLRVSQSQNQGVSQLGLCLEALRKDLAPSGFGPLQN